MRTADFHFDLPPELIAQHPAKRRDGSRLLVLTGKLAKSSTANFPIYWIFSARGRVRVKQFARDPRAFARRKIQKPAANLKFYCSRRIPKTTGGRCCAPANAPNRNPNPIAAKNGAWLKYVATVSAVNAEGHRRFQFSGTANIFDELDKLGELPLPPYIERPKK